MMTIRGSIILGAAGLALLLAGCLGNKDTQAPGKTPASGTPQQRGSAAETLTPPDQQKAPVEPIDTAVKIETVEFAVTGMSSAENAATLEAELIKLDGVSTVSANHETGSAKVQFDAAKVTTDQLIEAIKKLGFTAELKPGA